MYMIEQLTMSNNSFDLYVIFYIPMGTKLMNKIFA